MKKVIIIGGGAAGMQTALRLAERGIEALILEKEAEAGGKLRGWHALFPTFTPAEEVLTELRRRIEEKKIEIRTRSEVRSLTPKSVTLADGQRLDCDAVVLASGFTKNTATGSTTTFSPRPTSNGCSTRAVWHVPTARLRGASPCCTAWVRATKRYASNIARASAASQA